VVREIFPDKPQDDEAISHFAEVDVVQYANSSGNQFFSEMGTENSEHPKPCRRMRSFNACQASRTYFMLSGNPRDISTQKAK